MQYTGELSAILTALLWSGTSFAFASGSRRIGPIQTNVDRLIIASILLLLTTLIFNFSFNLSRNQVAYLIISGIVGLVIGDTFLFKAFQLIGARLSMLLMASSPAMSAIFAFVFLGEELSAWAIIGIAVTLSGISLVVLEKEHGKSIKSKISGFGLFCGFMGALGQAGGLILAKFAFQLGSIDKFVATFIRISSAVILIVPLMLVLKKYKNPLNIYKVDMKGLRAIAIGTVLGPYLGITFSLIAIDNTKVGIAATLMSTMPIIMLPMSKYIFKETLSWRAISGAVLAVAGIAILFVR
ncbi:MAG TPA: DMT family transporter [Ignavibacteriaceae bacterium]|nr:DMT family transporter [Ignavibacteriaceae bacterium]